MNSNLRNCANEKLTSATNSNCLIKYNFEVPLHSLLNPGGKGETSSPREPGFVCSNLAEVGEFFQDVKFLSPSPCCIVRNVSNNCYYLLYYINKQSKYYNFYPMLNL